MSNLKVDSVAFVREDIKKAAKVVIEALKPLELKISEVREVLAYIDDTIEHNVVLK